MSVAVQSVPKPRQVAIPSGYRFSVDQYHRMIQTGVLTENDRVELLEGWVVEKMTQNPPHASAVMRLDRRLTRLLAEEWLVRVQSPIVTADIQPEPDVAVVRGPEETYARRHPGRQDVALVVEVADTSVEEDRGLKRRLYARARLPVYWIVNLVETTVEVSTLPRGGRAPAYRQVQVYQPADDVPVVIGGEVVGHIPAGELLP
jgi:Uma2 family endonuclease